MNFARVWAMPSPDTFDIPPIGELVRRYLRQSRISVDPFARNKKWATYTNDLNPETAAEYHLDAYDFLCLLRDKRVRPDLVIFDPPYSRQQVKEVYSGIGRHYGIQDSQNHSTNWSKERDVIHEILAVNGIVISCGWNSGGMGSVRGYEMLDLLITPHGGNHNDTITVVERKPAHQASIFEFMAESGTTPHALDGRDSAPLQAVSSPEVLSTLQAVSTPARRK